MYRINAWQPCTVGRSELFPCFDSSSDSSRQTQRLERSCVIQYWDDHTASHGGGGAHARWFNRRVRRSMRGRRGVSDGTEVRELRRAGLLLSAVLSMPVCR